MKRVKISIFMMLLLLVFSCSVNNVRYTLIPNDKGSEAVKDNKTLLLYLYNEKGIIKDIDLISDTNEKIYSNNGFLDDKSKYLELKIPAKTKHIIVKFNKKRNNIEVKPNYNYLYLEFKGKDFIEVVYSNERPEFID